MVINICVFGDSVPFGRIDPENGGWVQRLKFYIEKQGLYNKVFNLGVPGDTSRDLINRIENETRVRKHDVIIIQIGFNDSVDIKGKMNVKLNEFEENIDKMIKISKKFTDKIIFLGLSNCDEEKTLKIKDFCFKENNLERCDAKINKICDKENITFISMRDVLDIKEDLEDGLHPNALGHEKIFKRILPFVEKMIKEIENDR
ncbi:MAG: GDSL-type esterase/lipase family protein [Candidatus Pacearchaeota archaeon]|nr:GDSL-type esterase/lipase family protein [Candidatus Pacearchaeota archaeon]